VTDDDAPSPRFDAAALSRLRSFGGDKLLRDMIELFHVHAPDRLSAARSAWVARDATRIESTLHSLTSTAAQLGALRMSRLCQRGESLAHAGQMDALGSVLNLLDGELFHTFEWLRSSMSESSSA
jgi:HPt (histidine-containing phosphotransfer) domain-containing protein